MTFRQSEFARHYAQGKPAAKAALAAGYTQSTAETNAARLLKSPEVINEIRRERNGLRIVTIDDVTRVMTRLMHIIDNAENPAHVLQATSQLLRYLRFQPDVWPEYLDKTDKKSAITPDIDDYADDLETPPAESCRGELHSPVPPPTSPVPSPETPHPDNPDKNPDTENALFEGSSPRTQTTGPLGPSEPQTSQPDTLDNPDNKSDHPTLNSPLSTINSPLTPEFLESVEDYALAEIVRQNPIMGRILAHKYPNHTRDEEPAYA